MLSNNATDPNNPLKIEPTVLRNLKTSSKELSHLLNSEYRALLAPEATPIIIDSGASTSLTPHVSNFIGPLEPAPTKEIEGLSLKACVIGKGTVEWTIRDYWNVVRVVRTMAYYVPDAQIRLFSPQTYIQENDDKGKCIILGQKAVLELPDGLTLKFSHQKGNNLPLMLTDAQFHHHTVGIHYSDAAFLSSGSPFQAFMSVME